MTRIFLDYSDVPSWERGSREKWDSLLPHALELERSGSRVRMAKNHELLHRVGKAYLVRGQFALAVEPLSACVAIRRRQLGRVHRITMDTEDDLVECLRESGQYSRAAWRQRRTVKFRRIHLPEEDMGIIRAVHSLGVIEYSMRRIERAVDLLREALKLYRRRPRGIDRNALNCINDLAVVLGKEKLDLTESGALLGEAHELCEDAFGSEDPETVRTLANLGRWMHVSGDLPGAEEATREALKTRRRILGERHPETLISKANLGSLLSDMGQGNAAERLLIAALEGMRDMLGETHPDSVAVQGELSRVLGLREKT